MTNQCNKYILFDQSYIEYSQVVLSFWIWTILVSFVKQSGIRPNPNLKLVMTNIKLTLKSLKWSPPSLFYCIF